MNIYEDPNSTSSPLNIHSGGRPTLLQSATTSSKPRLAQVFTRVAGNFKRSKNNKKKSKKSKKQKKQKKTKASSNCATCLSNPTVPSNAQSTVKSTKAQHDNTKSTSTKSPQKQPKTETKETDQSQSKYDETLVSFLRTKGYAIQSKLANTLQGAIYRCTLLNGSQCFAHDTVVIKVTRKDLHHESMTILENGKKKHIQENILKERDIIHELTATNDPRTIYMTRYVDFFEDNTSFYLVIEEGGSDLFEYVVRCHGLIRKGQLERKEWRLMCKKIFKQMIEYLDYLHSEHDICHLDISLENMLIENGTIFQNVNNGKITLNRDIRIKFCDFGLAEKFDARSQFKCTKYVGKTRYKSPELWTKKMVFDARMNDIWSLGITLFMCIIGVPPLKYPDHHDEHFQLIISGHLLELIQMWNRAKYMTPQILELLGGMLRKEPERFSLEEIKRHSWVKLQTK
eukprot:140205_1